MVRARRMQLSWAVNRWVLASPAAPYSTAEDNDMRVHDVRAIPKETLLGPDWQHSKPPSAAALPAWASSAGLPLSPRPTIDPQDRRGLDNDALLGAAVALDVLATRTRRLLSDSNILAQLADSLLQGAKAAGLDEPGASALLADADSSAADERTVLAKELSQVLAGMESPTDDIPDAAATSVEAVLAAKQNIERMAQAVVKAVRLRLAAYDTTQYRQA